MQKDYMNGKIKLGGCSVRVDVKQPRRDCRGCSFEWNMDKIDIKLELLEEALTEQVMLVRRIGVRISEFSDVEGQSSITNYF